MHTERFRAASHLLLRRVVADTENGSIREYFAKEASWEARLRQQFSDLASRLRERRECGEAAKAALRELNRWYRTRFKSEHLGLLQESLLNALGQSEWPLIAPPSLLECDDEGIHQLANTVENLLRDTHAAGANRPYSLVSKFLHFCFPNTFAIYDRQAGQSIRMWAFFAFDEAVQEEKKAASRFDDADLADTTGHGYFDILRFYRNVWAASHSNDRGLLELKALEIQERMRSGVATRDARVTTIDLIDKLLWKANGNPIRLGLAVAPTVKRLES